MSTNTNHQTHLSANGENKMNPSKKAWEVPALRSEMVQETLARPACKIKISINIGNRPGGGGHGISAQALFS
jgi:hypothetical protein